MNDETGVARTIEMVQGQIRDLVANLTEKKRMVNSLCGLIGQDPTYPIVEPEHGGTVLRSDEFYGKPITSVVRTILERRNAANLGAASTDAIYADMKRGGYQFDAKNEMTAKRSMAILLAKNSYLFHRLPNDDWGLVTWYPNIPKKTKEDKEPKEAKETKAASENGSAAMTDLDKPYKNEFAEDRKLVSAAERVAKRAAMKEEEEEEEGEQEP